MLTVKDFNRITFLHHRGIVPPSPAKEGETAVEKRFVCTANMKLLEYGYVMAYDLFEACCKATHTAGLSRKIAKLSQRLRLSGRISRTMRWKRALWSCISSTTSTI